MRASTPEACLFFFGGFIIGALLIHWYPRNRRVTPLVSALATFDAALGDSIKKDRPEQLRAIQFIRAVMPFLHDVVAELRPTCAELAATLEFLCEMGRSSGLSEFDFAADILGISSLVADLNRPRVLNGHRFAATSSIGIEPILTLLSLKPSSISTDVAVHNSRLEFRGRVSSTVDGAMIGGALIHMSWLTDADSRSIREKAIGRGSYDAEAFVTDVDGHFTFKTNIPEPTKISVSGQLRRFLLDSSALLVYPARLHINIQATGYQQLTLNMISVHPQMLISIAIPKSVESFLLLENCGGDALINYEFRMCPNEL